jgi:hypothetical protein
MDAAGSSETLVPIYQPTLYRIPQGFNFNIRQTSDCKIVICSVIKYMPNNLSTSSEQFQVLHISSE